MTNATDIQTNRKAADRLAELREQIKILEVEEKKLREGFISGDLPLEGDDCTVVVETKVNERIDLGAMREHVPEKVWKPFLISKPTAYVKAERKRTM